MLHLTLTASNDFQQAGVMPGPASTLPPGAASSLAGLTSWRGEGVELRVQIHVTDHVGTDEYVLPPKPARPRSSQARQMRGLSQRWPKLQGMGPRDSR